MKKLFWIILLYFAVVQCDPNLEYELHGFTEKIIVEGQIASGEFPRVYLSLNVPLWQEVDSALILDKVIRTAKVTVSDGTNTEVLTSSWDKEHYPPYVYKGTRLKGEVGKTYTLEVVYSGYTLTATTTIPERPDVKSFQIVASEDSDSLKVLSTFIDMDSLNPIGYKIYSKKKIDDVYIETKIVYNENLNLLGEQEFLVNPTPKITHPSYNEGGYFRTGDTVLIRVFSLDSMATNFFKSFTISSGMGKETAMFEELRSNVSNPGFGIWYGSGVKTYQLVVK